MIDIGPNLCNTKFDNDINQVIDNAILNNIKGLILTSTSISSFNKNNKIIASQKNKQITIKTTYGLHPHNADIYHDIFNQANSHLTNPNVCAIGEFGLDYFRMIATKENQLIVMNKFLELAQNSKLPLFLHERDAFNDFYSLLKDFNGDNKKVVHCFTGNKHQLKSYLDLDCYIGITGWITDNKRNSNLLEAIKYIPLDRLMIETDCPYLTPRNPMIKNQRNEPAYLKYIADYISNLLGNNINEITYNNSKSFFNI